LCQQGIVPLYTPVSGSWLNRAEARQRIIVRRALDGHHPQTATEIITWLEETVAGWNAEPTPFVWDGKRRKQRRRARHRRPAGAAALVDQPPNWRHDPLGGRVRLHRGDDAAVVVAAAGVEAPVRPGCRR